MTVGELISKKDYDYIEFRVTVPPDFPTFDEEMGEFYGACSSFDGILIPLDGDTYSTKEDLVMWEEWSDEESGIKNGLTVVEKGEWLCFE